MIQISHPFMTRLMLSALLQHSSHSSCQCVHLYFPCILLHEKNTSPHLRRTYVSAIFSKHLISEQPNCTSPLICSCDTVMTHKVPFWVPSCLHGSSHGISPLCSASSLPDPNHSQGPALLGKRSSQQLGF